MRFGGARFCGSPVLGPCEGFTHPGSAWGPPTRRRPCASARRSSAARPRACLGSPPPPRLARASAWRRRGTWPPQRPAGWSPCLSTSAFLFRAHFLSQSLHALPAGLLHGLGYVRPSTCPTKKDKGLDTASASRQYYHFVRQGTHFASGPTRHCCSSHAVRTLKKNTGMQLYGHLHGRTCRLLSFCRP